jgi:hypothetical protein
MKESPNKETPQLDVEFVVEELLDLFNEADDGSLKPITVTLSSHLGSTFHARVLNAAKHLGLLDYGP